MVPFLRFAIASIAYRARFLSDSLVFFTFSTSASAFLTGTDSSLRMYFNEPSAELPTLYILYWCRRSLSGAPLNDCSLATCLSTIIVAPAVYALLISFPKILPALEFLSKDLATEFIKITSSLLYSPVLILPSLSLR